MFSPESIAQPAGGEARQGDRPHPDEIDVQSGRAFRRKHVQYNPALRAVSAVKCHAVGLRYIHGADGHMVLEISVSKTP